MTVRVLPDAGGAARAAAEQLADCARRAVDEFGRCTLVLAGGSTPREAYELLAAEALPWERIHVFWSDERAVPPGHPDSNFRMVNRALLARINVPPANVHRMRGELRPAHAAEAYGSELEHFFGAGMPRFNLVLLGLGADAHTASLFPFDPLLMERRSPVGTSLPRRDRDGRVSLTFPAINSADEVVFLVAGASKARAVQQVVQGARDPFRLPAQGVVTGKLTWLLDRGAAAALR
jgi:6-phosphogluconolactonase